MSRTGPLTDVRVVEFVGLGPAPFAAMMLSDMGAEVVSITRPGAGAPDPRKFVGRGRTTVEIDIKSEAGQQAALALIAEADIVIEGFRPGVMERLGLGPEVVHARNPRLVFGRMTGWGQSGPLAPTAGHDINYIAVTGALDAIRGQDGAPIAPLNLVGDYGGGSLYLVAGLLAALHEAKRSGLGQIVDAAIVDGVASLLTPTWSFKARGHWGAEPGRNLLDGGAPFYRTYQCQDGAWLAVGAAESHFYKQFRTLGGFDDPAFDAQMDQSAWPDQSRRLEAAFATRPRQEWLDLFDGSDACVTPVVSLDEAVTQPHMAAREAFVDHEGHRQPAPAPRLSRTPLAIQSSNAGGPTSAADVLQRWRPAPQA